MNPGEPGWQRKLRSPTSTLHGINQNRVTKLCENCPSSDSFILVRGSYLLYTGRRASRANLGPSFRLANPERPCDHGKVAETKNQPWRRRRRGGGAGRPPRPGARRGTAATPPARRPAPRPARGTAGPGTPPGRRPAVTVTTAGKTTGGGSRRRPAGTTGRRTATGARRGSPGGRVDTSRTATEEWSTSTSTTTPTARDVGTGTAWGPRSRRRATT